MKLTFLGGSNEIGSAALLVENGEFRGIFDYGLTPSNPPTYPLEAPPVNYIFLTHAHLDHSGMIPWLTRRNQAPFFTSQMTYNLSEILLKDNLKICEMEGYTKMYSREDIRNIFENMRHVEMDSRYNLDHCKLFVHSAGHIPGATMFEIEFNDGLRLLYTGDINTIDTRLVNGTRGKKCDILIMESTYADRDHELRQKIEYSFQENIKKVIDRGGKVIIPAFAVGRTQEILLILADMGLDIWLDGLGNKVTRLILKEPRFIANEKKLHRIFEKIHRIRRNDQRKKALSGEVIVTTSGMLDGGPVLRYIKELNHNPKNALFLTGYQVEGTNGRLLLDKGLINIYGVQEKINLDVQYYDFSAHAGHNELIEFANNCDPEHIVLFHGDNRKTLHQELGEQYQIHLPNDGESFRI